MLDTITLRLVYQPIDKQKLEHFFSTNLILKSQTEYLKGYKGRSLRGTYGSWNFYLNDTNVKIVGSLTSAAKGNNIQNSYFEEIVKAITELQSQFCLELCNADIIRLDVAYNLFLDQPAYSYYATLICPIGFKKVTFENETLEFRSRNISFKFYDKVIERIERKKLPSKFKKAKILRYELSLNRLGIKKIHKINLKLNDLLDEVTYQSLINAWFDQFLQIPKRKNYILPRITKATISGFKDFAVRFLLNNNEGYEFTDAFLRDKGLSSKVRYDIKKYISGLNLGATIENPLEDELRTKIINAYCRS